MKSEGEALFGGRIVLIGEEPHPPYDRPPLSKGVLIGRETPADTLLREESRAAASR